MAVLETGRPEDVGLDPERIGWARAMVHDHVASGRSPSVAAVVARHGTVVLAEAAGVQHPGGPPLALDHLWPLASATKPFCAAALLSLVEEGRVGIYEPVLDHLPELAGTDSDDVLVHHLLTHTSGWESEMLTGRIEAVLASGEIPPLPPDRDPFTAFFLALAFDPIRFCAPGETMSYANVNYELLAEIVRRTTGGSFDDAVRGRVFEPLGMKRSTVRLTDELRPHLVTRDPDLPMGANSPTISLDSDAWRDSDSGASGVLASPVDLARFGQAILDGGALDGRRILAPSTVRSMTTDQIPGTPARWIDDRIVPHASWGYGFGVTCEQRWPWFGGGLQPFGTASHPGAGGVTFWIDRTHGIVGVWFEVITEMSPALEPMSGVGHRFPDVVTAAVVDP